MGPVKDEGCGLPSPEKSASLERHGRNGLIFAQPKYETEGLLFKCYHYISFCY